jgi:hypothetical protein
VLGIQGAIGGDFKSQISNLRSEMELKEATDETPMKHRFAAD